MADTRRASGCWTHLRGRCEFGSSPAPDLSCDKLSQPLCCHRCGKGAAIYRPHSALRNLRCPQKGSRFATPLLPWDGVALSYPTDATICRTGTAVAPCDNGAAADRLAGVRISDAGGAASSCPNFGRLPRVSCYKMPRRRSCPVPYAHGCTVSSYSSIGRGSGI